MPLALLHHRRPPPLWQEVSLAVLVYGPKELVGPFYACIFETCAKIRNKNKGNPVLGQEGAPLYLRISKRLNSLVQIYVFSDLVKSKKPSVRKLQTRYSETPKTGTVHSKSPKVFSSFAARSNDPFGGA